MGIELIAAMASFRDCDINPKRIGRQATVNFSFYSSNPDHSFTIVLHPPENGDRRAITKLLTFRSENTDNQDEIALALADPMPVLESEHNGSTRTGPIFPVILSTFIDRAALWGVYVKPNEKSGDDAPLRELLNTFDQNQQLLTFGQNVEGLRIACHGEASTNLSLARAFFSIVKLHKEVDQFGRREILPVIRGEVHLALTATPWLFPLALQGQSLSRDAIGIERFIPPIVFPYSAVIGTDRALRGDQHENLNFIIKTFLQALNMAIIFTQRDWNRVAGHLAQRTVFERYRAYGLYSDVRELPDADVGPIVAMAVKKMVGKICLSDFPFDPWHSWESALLVERKARDVYKQIEFMMPPEERKQKFQTWSERTLAITDPKYYSFLNTSGFAEAYSGTISSFLARYGV
jgi:hypothetical protein